MNIPTEKLNEFKRIRKGLEIYKLQTEYNRDLELNMSEEALKLNYDKPLQNAIKNIEYYSNKIKEINETLIKYSIFNYKTITNVLRVLIRVYEGKNFILEDVNYQPNPERKIITEEARVLVNQDKAAFNDIEKNKDKLYAMQKHGDAIILDWKIKSKEFVKFYDLAGNDNLKHNIKTNKFQYVMDFIDYVVTFCYKNNIDEELTEEHLFELMKLFVFEHVEDIKRYHEEIKQQEENDMRKQIIENSQYRNKQLKKVLDRFNGGKYEI